MMLGPSNPNEQIAFFGYALSVLLGLVVELTLPFQPDTLLDAVGQPADVAGIEVPGASIVDEIDSDSALVTPDLTDVERIVALQGGLEEFGLAVTLELELVATHVRQTRISLHGLPLSFVSNSEP